MTISVDAVVPDLEVEAWVRNADAPQTFSLSDFRGQWLVLFFYPRDFTFICPTEIAALAALHPSFIEEDAVVLGASTDSFFCHKAWFETDDRLREVNYPVIADTSHELTRAFGVLLPDGRASRATFIIDPKGVLLHSSVTNHDAGRNVDEILRVLQALKTGALCPANWRPGEATLTPA
jgi:peroxiredoxin (alkyl hydroperoxide reductase subunit C)